MRVAIVHAYEARINARFGFFPYLLQFNSPHRVMSLEFHLSETVQAFMDYIACKHVVSLGVHYNEPQMGKEFIEEHKSGILASIVFSRISKFAYDKAYKIITLLTICEYKDKEFR